MKKLYGISSLLIALSALADLPLFSIIGPPPVNFNTTYSYQVTNNATYALNNAGLIYAPTGLTPQGFVQITSGSNACTNPISLGAGANCTLYYQIDYTQLVDNVAIGGPEICYSIAHPIYCSVPDLSSQIDLLYTIPSLITGTAGANPYQPFFIQNYKMGGLWITGPSLYPATSTLSIYNSADCNASLCVIAGFDPVHPIQAYSLNNGVNWLTNTALTLNPGQFFSTSCAPESLGACISVGNFNCVSAPGGACPALIVSHYTPSFGWNEVFFGISVPGIFFASACDDTTCAAGGTNNQTTPAPILYQSLDNGVTWNSVLPTLPYTSKALISAVSCGGPTCVALGNTVQPSSSLFYPFVLIQPAGSGPSTPWVLNDLYAQVFTFSPAISVAALAPPTPQALSCSENLCVAVGSDTNATPIQTKIIESLDAGVTWAEVTSPPQVPHGTFYSVSCGSSTCVAVGYISTGGPLMYQTMDLGLTWTISNINLASTVQLTTTNCDENNFCVVSGVDTSSTSGIVYQTLDEGTTWIPANLSTPLPTNMIIQGSYAH